MINRQPHMSNQWLPSALWLVSLASGCLFAAAPESDPLLTFDVIENPIRTYYTKLTDPEYSSVSPNHQFLGYILQSWSRRPIASDDYFGLPKSKYCPDASVQMQRQFLLKTKDPVLRSRTVTLLANCGNPTAVGLLTALLKGEKDVNVIADVLAAVAILEDRSLAPVIAPLLTHESKRVRLHAIKLYGIQVDADVRRLLERIPNEPALHLRTALWQVVAANADQTTLADWLPIWDTSDTDAIAVSFRAVFGFSEITGQWDRIVAFCKGDDVPIKKAIADNLSPNVKSTLNDTIIELLVADRHAAARAAAADAIARLRLDSSKTHLLTLAGDPEAEVRRSVAHNLRVFPDKPGFLQLVQLTGDPGSPLTRDKAQESLVAIASPYPVEAEIGVYVDDANEDIRYNTFRVLAAVDSSMYNEGIRRRLLQEERPINIAAAIRSLVAGGATFAIESILGYADHEHKFVRTAVGEMIGVFKPKSGHEIIKRYSQEDREMDVREPAIVAMGLIRDTDFNGTLLKILQRTNYAGPEFLQEADRIRACWSASRIHDPSIELMRQMRRQIMEMVVLTAVGPTYDSDTVRASACWALAIQSKRTNDSEILALARGMINHLDRDVLAEQRERIYREPPSNYILQYYAYQARQFLVDEPIVRCPSLLGEFRFDYRLTKVIRLPYPLYPTKGHGY